VTSALLDGIAHVIVLPLVTPIVLTSESADFGTLLE